MVVLRFIGSALADLPRLSLRRILELAGMAHGALHGCDSRGLLARMPANLNAAEL
jgi:hypothetical protein